MRDWAKIIAETETPTESAEDLVKKILSRSNLPGLARFAEPRGLMGSNFIGPEEI